MNLLRLRGHHIAFYAETRYSPYFNGKDLEDYGRFKENMEEFLKKIDQAAARVLVVKGLDDICNITNPACPQKDGFCGLSHQLDDSCLREYGLKTGDILNSEILREKILKYHRKTGFFSFRDKYWVENGLISK